MVIIPFLIILGILFVGLIFILKYMMGKSMTDATAHLQSMSADYALRQEELKRQLMEAERNYQERMARARTEAEQLISEARQEVESYRTKRLEDARVESERIMEQAIESRDGLRKELEREIDKRSILRACEIVEEALPQDVRHGIQSYWLQEIVQGGSEQLKQLESEEKASEAKVLCSVPMTTEQKRTLEARLKEHLGKQISLVEEVDDRLVAGFTITVGSLVLDASLASKIRHHVKQIKEATS